MRKYFTFIALSVVFFISIVQVHASTLWNIGNDDESSNEFGTLNQGIYQIPVDPLDFPGELGAGDSITIEFNASPSNLLCIIDMVDASFKELLQIVWVPVGKIMVHSFSNQLSCNFPHLRSILSRKYCQS